MGRYRSKIPELLITRRILKGYRELDMISPVAFEGSDVHKWLKLSSVRDREQIHV